MELPNNYPCGAPFPFQPPPGFVFPPTRDPVGPGTERSLLSQGAFWPAQSSATPTSTTHQHQQPPVWAGPFAQHPLGGAWATTAETRPVPEEVQKLDHLQPSQPRGQRHTNTPATDEFRIRAETNTALYRAERAEQLLEDVRARERKAVQRADDLEKEVAELRRYKGEKASLYACSIDELKRIDEVLKQGRKNVKAVLQAKEREQNVRPECAVCLDKPRETVFLPCQHMACCDECGKKLQTCPICRSAVQRTVFVHHC